MLLSFKLHLVNRAGLGDADAKRMDLIYLSLSLVVNIATSWNVQDSPLSSSYFAFRNITPGKYTKRKVFYWVLITVCHESRGNILYSSHCPKRVPRWPSISFHYLLVCVPKVLSSGNVCIIYVQCHTSITVPHCRRKAHCVPTPCILEGKVECRPHLAHRTIISPPTIQSQYHSYSFPWCPEFLVVWLSDGTEI